MGRVVCSDMAPRQGPTEDICGLSYRTFQTLLEGNREALESHNGPYDRLRALLIFPGGSKETLTHSLPTIKIIVK